MTRYVHPALRRSLLAITVALAAAPALADDDCDAPAERWQSRDAVRQMAAQRGWQIQRLKIDDGCYEIRGRDADGREFKARLDPETLAVVKMKRRDGGHERSRDPQRARAQSHDGRDGASAAAASGTAPASPVFTHGTAPRGQIE
ncbi:MAG TPA: PepSY domain-containing protein [Burkholderiaceae bacterium]|jgi:hypothetical protein|nr:PepSY domain-containing protein [Burkholderiaceae bacterium]